MQNYEDLSCLNVVYNRTGYIYGNILTLYRELVQMNMNLPTLGIKSSHPEVFLYLTRHSLDIQRGFIKTNLYSMSPDMENVVKHK